MFFVYSSVIFVHVPIMIDCYLFFYRISAVETYEKNISKGNIVQPVIWDGVGVLIEV